MTLAMPSDSLTTTGRAEPSVAGQPNRPAKAGHAFARLLTDQRQAGTTLASDSASPVPAPARPASDLPAPTGRALAASSPAGTPQASPPADPRGPLTLGHSEPTVGAPSTRAARIVRTTTASPTAVEAPQPPDLSAAAPVMNAGLLVGTPQNSPVEIIGSDAKPTLAESAAAGGIERVGASNGGRAGPTPQAVPEAVTPSVITGFSPGLGQAALAAPPTRQTPAAMAQVGPVPVDIPHSVPASANAGAAPRVGRVSSPGRVAVDRSTPDHAGLAGPITDPDSPATVTPMHAVVDGATRSHPAGPAIALQQAVPGAQPTAAGPVPEPATLSTRAPAIPGALVPGEPPAQALTIAGSVKLPDELAVDTLAVPLSASLAGLSLTGLSLTGPLLTGPDGPRTSLAASPPLPAAQVAAALATLPAPVPTNGAGPLTPPRVLSVQLDPEELGRVRIRIDQGGDGPARVDLTAERPETLQLLLRDQTALHHALDQAGVTPDARVIRFHLADAGAIAPAPTAPLPQPQASFGGGFGLGGQTSGQADGQHRGQAAPQATPDSGFGLGWNPPNPITTRPTGNRARVDIIAYFRSQPMTTTSAFPATAATGSTTAATSAGLTGKSQIAGSYSDFLKLLMTQLKNQDPTAPLDTNQFTQQLVQFSSVEQQLNTNTNLTKLIALQEGGQVLQSSALVGKTVRLGDLPVPLTAVQSVN